MAHSPNSTSQLSCNKSVNESGENKQNAAPGLHDDFVASCAPEYVKLHDPEDVHEKATVSYERQGAEDDDHDVVADSVRRRGAVVVKVVPRISFLRLKIHSIGRVGREGGG